jgi:hypothetical protein
MDPVDTKIKNIKAFENSLKSLMTTAKTALYRLQNNQNIKS